MKRIILTIALFIIIINIASAQLTIGPKIGLNMSKEYSGIKLYGLSYDENVDFKAGLNIGAFGKYEINDKFDIQAELLYSQQGFKHNVPLADYGGNVIKDGYKFSSHYFNIPLVIKYYPFERIYLEAGPQAGFCLNSKLSPKEYAEGILDMDYNTIDFSLVGGIGLDIGYGLSVNARYNHGFTYTLQDSKWKNRVIQISLAYNLWNF